MEKILDILAVGGFKIQKGDDSDFWRLIDAVDELAYTRIEEQEWDTLEDNMLLARDIVICYSWGVASVFKAFARLKKAGKLTALPLLIVMAGVPRGLFQWLDVKFSGGWKVPDEVGTAVCLQVNSFPVSYPIIPSGPTRINRLLAGIEGNDHVKIQNAREANEFVVSLISGIANGLNGL